MNFLVFKDIVFDLINECNQFDIKDLSVRDAENIIRIEFMDGLQAEITFRELNPQKDRGRNISEKFQITKGEILS